MPEAEAPVPASGPGVGSESGSLFEVALPAAAASSTERLCPKSEDEIEQGVEPKTGRRCGCLLILVPTCSIILTAALATLTAGALLAASCATRTEYRVACDEVRTALLNMTSRNSSIPGSSFKVLSHDSSHVKLSLLSPVNGAVYHLYFGLDALDRNTCSCQAVVSSSVWFQPDDAGAGWCALQHFAALGLTEKESDPDSEAQSGAGALSCGSYATCTVQQPHNPVKL